MFKKLTSCICCIMVLSCGKSEGNNIEMTRDLRIQIDTTSNRQISLLAATYDSLCRTQTPTLTRQLTDSLVQVRKQIIQEKMMQ